MNLTALQAAIQAKGYGTETAAQQLIFLNECYREICGMQRWPFLEKQDVSTNTVAGTPGYTLTFTDWRNFDAVRLQQTSLLEYFDLEYLQPQEFRKYEHLARDQNVPEYWTFINQQLHFYPNPDAVYNVVIDYIMEPPDLSAGADIPVLPLPYHDVLVWGAIESLAYRERDWLGRQFAQQKKEMMLKRMNEEYLIHQRQTTSHVAKNPDKYRGSRSAGF